MCRLCSMSRAYTGLDGVPLVRWEVDKSLPNPKVVFIWWLLKKKKNSFSQRSLTEYTRHAQEQPHALQEMSNTEGAQWYFGRFYIIILCLGILFFSQVFCLYIMLSTWCFYGVDVCAGMYGSVSFYGFLMLCLRLFPFVCYFLTYTCLFVFILALFLYF